MVEFVVKTVDPLVEGGIVTTWEDGNYLVIWWRVVRGMDRDLITHFDQFSHILPQFLNPLVSRIQQ